MVDHVFIRYLYIRLKTWTFPRFVFLNLSPSTLFFPLDPRLIEGDKIISHNGSLIALNGQLFSGSWQWEIGLSVASGNNFYRHVDNFSRPEMKYSHNWMFLYSSCGSLPGIDLFCMHNKIVIVHVKKVKVLRSALKWVPGYNLFLVWETRR